MALLHILLPSKPPCYRYRRRSHATVLPGSVGSAGRDSLDLPDQDAPALSRRRSFFSWAVTSAFVESTPLPGFTRRISRDFSTRFRVKCVNHTPLLAPPAESGPCQIRVESLSCSSILVMRNRHFLRARHGKCPRIVRFSEWSGVAQHAFAGSHRGRSMSQAMRDANLEKSLTDRPKGELSKNMTVKRG